MSEVKEGMSGKEKYDERRRLRAERLLRQEQQSQRKREDGDKMEAAMMGLFTDVSRIADSLEAIAARPPTKSGEGE